MIKPFYFLQTPCDKNRIWTPALHAVYTVCPSPNVLSTSSGLSVSFSQIQKVRFVNEMKAEASLSFPLTDTNTSRMHGCPASRIRPQQGAVPAPRQLTASKGKQHSSQSSGYRLRSAEPRRAEEGAGSSDQADWEASQRDNLSDWIFQEQWQLVS